MGRTKTKQYTKQEMVQDLLSAGYVLVKETLRWGTGELYHHPQHNTYRYVTPHLTANGKLDWRVRTPYQEFMTVLHTWQPTAQADIDWMSTQMLNEFQKINENPIYPFAQVFSWSLTPQDAPRFLSLQARFFGWLRPVGKENYAFVPGWNVRTVELAFQRHPVVQFVMTARKYQVSDLQNTYLEVF